MAQRNASYVSDRRQYYAAGKRTGGGWCVVENTARGYEAGIVYPTKREALALPGERSTWDYRSGRAHYGTVPRDDS